MSELHRSRHSYDTDAVLGFAKTAPDFAPGVANGTGKLGKVTVHRCAQLRHPQDPVVATDGAQSSIGIPHRSFDRTSRLKQPTEQK